MFKMFLAAVLSFLSAIALTRLNGELEWPLFWFSLVCGAASFVVTKAWFSAFKIESSLGGKPKVDGSQKSISASTYFALFVALVSFLFSLLG